MRFWIALAITVGVIDIAIGFVHNQIEVGLCGFIILIISIITMPTKYDGEE